MQTELKWTERRSDLRPPLESDILLAARLPELEALKLSGPGSLDPDSLPKHLLQRHQMIRRRLADHWADELSGFLSETGPETLLNAVRAAEQRLSDWALAAGRSISSDQRENLEAIAASIEEIFSDRSVLRTLLLAEIQKQTQSAFSYRTPDGVDGFYSRFVRNVSVQKTADFVQSLLKRLDWRSRLLSACSQMAVEHWPNVKEEDYNA